MDKVKFVNWLQKDYWYIVFILLAVFACIWTLGHTRDYINDCNDFWAEKWEYFSKECYCTQATENYIDLYKEFYNKTDGNK